MICQFFVETYSAVVSWPSKVTGVRSLCASDKKADHAAAANTGAALRKDKWGNFLQFFRPFFLSKNMGFTKNRYHHRIGRKKIRRMVYSDPEKLNGRPDFGTFSFFPHLSHSSFRSAGTVGYSLAL